jgi:hypothetical protein
MNNNENKNWREIVAGFSSYEGTLGILPLTLPLIIRWNLKSIFQIFKFPCF